MSNGGPWAVADPVAGGGWFWPSLVLALLGMTGLGVWAVLRILRDVRNTGTALVNAAGDAATRTANGIAAALRSAFQVDPVVRVHGEVKAQGTFAARELVTCHQVLVCRKEWSQQRFGSTKTISMAARFSVKAGFDLRRPVRLDVDDDGTMARVQWPEARVLSVHIEEFLPAQEESGWWNRITPEDRASLQAELQRMAEDEARAAGLLSRAEDELRRLVHEQIRPPGAALALSFGGNELPALALPAPMTPSASSDASILPEEPLARPGSDGPRISR